MEQLHFLFRTEAEVQEAFGSFVWNCSGAPKHDELGPLVRSTCLSNKHYVDDEVVAPVQVQYLSADSSAEEGRGNGPKPPPPSVVSAEMQRIQAIENNFLQIVTPALPPFICLEVQGQLHDSLTAGTASGFQ